MALRARAMEDLVMFGGFYAGRRVFVTGHTGFKGSWLSYWLTQLGAEVTGYALDPPTDPSLFEALDLGGLVRHVVADVRDFGRLSAELVASRPDVVFHLAAQPLVRQSYQEPRETFETNVMGTVNVLQALRACDSVAAAIVITSDKCYRNLEDGRAYVEDDPMGGRDPYSASKGCAELVSAAYGASFFSAGPARVATVRAGNVIGGGDWAPDRLVPDCVRALAAGRPVGVRNPDAVRPWQHVLEPLAGYLWLGARMGAGDGASGFAGPWNFGPDVSGVASTRVVVNEFINAWGRGSWSVVGGQDEAPHEAAVLVLDPAKARRRLGWRAIWSLDEAVAATAAWYTAFYSGATTAAAVAATTREQIARYEAGARTLAMPWAAGGS